MVLQENPSKSTDAVYEIRKSDRDGVIYCTCPGWRNSKADPKTCRHLREWFEDHPPAA